MSCPVVASKYSADGRDAADIWIVFKAAPAGLNSLNRASVLLRNPDIARTVQGERARARDIDIKLPDAVRAENPNAISREVARIEKRTRCSQSGDDIATRLRLCRADGDREIACFTGPVISPYPATAVSPVILQGGKDRDCVARNGAALELVVQTDGTPVLAVAVYRDAACVLVPQGSRVDDSLGRYPHGTGAVTDVGGIRPIGVRNPVSGVLRQALRCKRREQHSGKYGMNAMFQHERHFPD